jgi:hypothetical protein
MHIDINSDMGESYGAWVMGADDQIMPNITSANIACGFHGGDPKTIDKTIKLAKKHGVAVGAHPSYPDLQGFGRRRMTRGSAIRRSISGGARSATFTGSKPSNASRMPGHLPLITRQFMPVSMMTLLISSR